VSGVTGQPTGLVLPLVVTLPPRLLLVLALSLPNLVVLTAQEQRYKHRHVPTRYRAPPTVSGAVGTLLLATVLLVSPLKLVLWFLFKQEQQAATAQTHLQPRVCVQFHACGARGPRGLPVLPRVVLPLKLVSGLFRPPVLMVVLVALDLHTNLNNVLSPLVLRTVDGVLGVLSRLVLLLAVVIIPKLEAWSVFLKDHLAMDPAAMLSNVLPV